MISLSLLGTSIMLIAISIGLNVTNSFLKRIAVALERMAEKKGDPQ